MEEYEGCQAPLSRLSDGLSLEEKCVEANFRNAIGPSNAHRTAICTSECACVATEIRRGRVRAQARRRMTISAIGWALAHRTAWDATLYDAIAVLSDAFLGVADFV